MAEDIRIKMNFKGHRKRRKLRKLLGPSYLDHLMDLWLTAAEERPSGEFSGWDDDDLVYAASKTVPFKGSADKLKHALLDAGFADEIENILVLHNWKKHQEWVISEPSRIAKSRHANTVKKIKTDYYKDCHGHYSEDSSEVCSKGCPLFSSGDCPFKSQGAPPFPSLPFPSLPFLSLPAHLSKGTPYSPPQGGHEQSGKNNGIYVAVEIKCLECGEMQKLNVTKSAFQYMEKGNMDIASLRVWPCSTCGTKGKYEYAGRVLV